MAELDLTNIADASIATPAAGVTAVYANSTSKRLSTKDDAGVITVLPTVIAASSVAAVASGYATDTYLAGSCVTVPVAGDWTVGETYYCVFDMVKTANGTAAFAVTVRMGTLGTVSDASVLQLAFAVGTAAIDTGVFELWLTFRTVGSGTSAVVAAVLRCQHHLAATGLVSTGASGSAIVLGTSSGFASNTPTKIGISVNGGTSFSGTNTIVQAQIVK